MLQFISLIYHAGLLYQVKPYYHCLLGQRKYISVWYNKNNAWSYEIRGLVSLRFFRRTRQIPSLPLSFGTGEQKKVVRIFMSDFFIRKRNVTIRYLIFKSWLWIIESSLRIAVQYTYLSFFSVYFSINTEAYLHGNQIKPTPAVCYPNNNKKKQEAKMLIFTLLIQCFFSRYIHCCILCRHTINPFKCIQHSIFLYIQEQYTFVQPALEMKKIPTWERPLKFRHKTNNFFFTFLQQILRKNIKINMLWRFSSSRNNHLTSFFLNIFNCLEEKKR